MHRFAHIAMAAQFEIHCTHHDATCARQAAACAFRSVDRLEQQLSRFVENSDISRINHLSAGEHTIVSYETMQCLQLAQFISKETEGAFDVSVGTASESLELFPGEFIVCAHSGGTRLDLGAIGKGFAVDRAAEVLEEWEVDRILIDAGRSSVLALEPPCGFEDWALALSEPGKTHDGVLARIAARQRALGASGIQKQNHILDPRTRVPVRSRKAAWVSAPREILSDISKQAHVEPSPAAVADALSTAFMIMPFEEIRQYCDRHPGVEVWILEQNFVHFGMQNSATDFTDSRMC
jgi:FAD:protein FMN transferase